MSEKTLAEKLKQIDQVSLKINEKSGKEIVGRLSENKILSEKIQHRFIPTPSLNFNEAIGGGFPKGAMTIISGDSDSGKTYILLETIAQAQKNNPNFIALWLESEASLRQSILDEVGIDMQRFIYLEHERDGAGEMAIDRIEAYLTMGVADMIVINSLKALVPSEEFKKDMGSLQVGAAARMNAKMVRKLTSLVQEHDVCMTIVQHLTTQIGGMIFGDPLVLSGGQAIKYGAILIVDLRKRSIQESDPISREEGVKIGVTVKKNHAVHGRNPYQKTEYYGIYGQGTEKYLETLQLAIDQGILTKAGAFIRMPDEKGDALVINGEKMQWQGAAKFRQYCIDNPKFFNDTQAMVTGQVISMTDEEIAEAKREAEEMDEEIAKKTKKNSKTSK